MDKKQQQQKRKLATSASDLDEMLAVSEWENWQKKWVGQRH